MGVKVTNNGFGTISAGINSSATTVTVDSGQGARFPTLGSGDYFYGTLIDTSNNIEIIKVTARSTDSMTVTRAQDNTTARAFSIGDRLELRPTAALFEDILAGGVEVVADTSPQLGGNLDLNSNNITGTGNVNITGTVTSTGALNTGSSSITTTGTVNVATVDLGNWTITEAGGVLKFATGGTVKMKLDASGNLTCVGDVTANGTM